MLVLLGKSLVMAKGAVLSPLTDENLVPQGIRDATIY
jgi:hypothetical protein